MNESRLSTFLNLNFLAPPFPVVAVPMPVFIFISLLVHRLVFKPTAPLLWCPSLPEHSERNQLLRVIVKSEVHLLSIAVQTGELSATSYRGGCHCFRNGLFSRTGWVWRQPRLECGVW